MDRVVIVAFDGVQTLDVMGPAEVFSTATRRASARYRVEVATVGGGMRGTSSGISIATVDLARLRPRSRDIVLVAGGADEPIRAASADRALRAWLVRAARLVRVVGSVCSGAFVLAAAGLLDGRRAATHWSACDQLAAAFPAVKVDRNAIFVRDGNVWTSAGVTTGIDMALALVEADHDRSVADVVAAQLVLYVRRPGFQSQFSDALVAQTADESKLAAVIAWARGNLRSVDVDALAVRAGLSRRTFHRRCLDQLATTPARLIEKLRVERARTLLEVRAVPAKQLAIDCGFGSTPRMNRAFAREVGLSPAAYRVLHARVSEARRAPARATRRRRTASRSTGGRSDRGTRARAG